jgi:probable poly-beta-1,6-N-acetyl-D-glucosamine export protein
MARRIVEMDIARGLAAAAVVVIHVAQGAHGHNNERQMCLRLAVYVTARFAVPVFVMLSGMGLALSHGPNRGYLQWLGGRVGKIAIGYLVWSAAYTLFFDTSTGSIVRPHVASLASFPKNVISGGSCYHLYFIPRLIGLYALYPIVDRWLPTTRGVVAAFVFAAVLAPLFRTLDSRPELWMWSLLSGPIRWIPYLAAGIWVSRYEGIKACKEPRNRRLVLAALLLCIGALILLMKLVATSRAGMDAVTPLVKILAAPYSVVIVAWIWSREWSSHQIAAPIRFVSRYSYGIYLSHPLVLSAFYQAISGAKWTTVCPTAIWLAIAFAVGMAGSIAVSMSGDYLRSRIFTTA